MINIRFNRQELAGAFGDIGTDFPLLVGMILAARLDACSVLVMYGLMQIFTGLIYQRPMPVQPLKAVAALVITQKLAAGTLYGGGLAIGAIMLILTLSGLLDVIARHIPKMIVRGIQLGLGMSLGLLALKEYLPKDGAIGYVLGVIALILIFWLLPNKRFPAALAVIVLGVIYAFMFKLKWMDLNNAFGFSLPSVHLPNWSDIVTGFVLLALPQIPLSLGNSILATRQVNEDLFPQKPLTIRKIGGTYSVMNLINPFFGGVPVCHGSGGMIGHYTFGSRTGGSIVIYGLMYLIFGLFFSQGFSQMINIFPMPILGVILLVEALGLMVLVGDISSDRRQLWIAFMVAIAACALPYGFIIGLVAGILAARFYPRIDH